MFDFTAYDRTMCRRIRHYGMGMITDEEFMEEAYKALEATRIQVDRILMNDGSLQEWSEAAARLTKKHTAFISCFEQMRKALEA